MEEKERAISIPLIANEININSDASQKSKQNAKASAGVISRIFFCWVLKIIKVCIIFLSCQLANKTTLENDMIDDLAFQDKCEQLFVKFSTIFEQYSNAKYTLFKSLIKAYRGQLIIGYSLTFFQLSLQMAIPVLIHSIINYIQNPDKTIQEGAYLVGGIFICQIFSGLLESHSTLIIREVGYSASSVAQMALMNKSLHISFQSNKKHKTGEVMNLMQVDSNRIYNIWFQIQNVLFMPIEIGVSIYLMFSYIGLSFVAGLGIIFITSIINFFIGKIGWKYQKILMKAKDERTKSANELFYSIKFIKISALEDYFVDKLLKLRDREISLIQKRFIVTSFSILSVWISPLLIQNATFGMYVLLGNNLTPANTFAIISIFQIIQEPLRSLPQMISSLIESFISINRIETYLLTNEVMTKCILSGDSSNPISIKISNGQFHWKQKGEKDTSLEEQKKEKEKEKEMKQKSKSKISSAESQQINDDQYRPTIRNINLQIQKGQFIAIIGELVSVGSGKSSLIQSILGEMIYDQEVTTPQIHVSQKAWIQNATVKENIIFGLPFDEIKYRKAVKYACLRQDIKILIKGDQTMIGEKGVNLSGGQKARISLARAIYSERDIYLLDDPISAVDVHVGKFIINETLNGYLKERTRVLITHALNYCQYSDKIYLLEDGQIIEEGDFQSIQQSPRFKLIYSKFHKNNQEEEKENEENIEEIIEGHQLKLKKQMSSLEDNEKKIDHKPNDEIDNLMMEEDRNRGSITSETYAKYFKFNGGFSFFGLVFLVQTIWMISRVGSTIWIADWTEKSEKNSESINNTYYLIIYSVFSLVFGLMAFIRALMFVINCTNSANLIHYQMIQTQFLRSLVYAPQCTFFERVPLGRIMNRLTKDQNTLDSELYWYASSFSVSFFLLIGTIILNVYGSSYYIFIPIALFLIVSWKVQRIYMNASRELYRLGLNRKYQQKSDFESFLRNTLWNPHNQKLQQGN